MDEGLEVVASYPDAIEAHLALNLLDEHGIKGLLQDENLSQIGWHFTQAIGGVKVCVSRKDFENAAKIIAQQESYAAEIRNQESHEEELARIHLENPRRAYKTALFGCFFPPLLVWALWIVLREWKPVRSASFTSIDRRYLMRAGVISTSCISFWLFVMMA